MKNNKGFTLIELIVVIAILAILAVALIPLINSFIEKSRVSQLMTTGATLETAAVAYNADIGIFPPDDNATFAESDLAVNGFGKNNWDGPYLNRNTEGISPWGSQMILDSNRDVIGELDGNGEDKEDYLLIVASDSSATVPIASYAILEGKVDGTTVSDPNDGAGEGKAQRGDDNSGTNDDNSPVIIVIIADAFLSTTNKDTGSGGGEEPIPQAL